MTVTIRLEKPADKAAIYDITKRAFAPMPFSGGDEPDLIDRLRDADALEISLVAEMDGAVVGQVSFTRGVTADDSDDWYALGPVAVEPELQKQHVGSALINAGIAMLRERRAAGCVLVGNPEYYKRFGFRVFPKLAPEGEPAEYYQILPLRVEQPDIVVGFHPLFYG